MEGNEAGQSRFPSLWNGLGLFALALLLWLFLTPCDWQSPAFYLPPFVVGLLLGRRYGRKSWSLRLRVAGVYGLALAVLALAIVLLTGGPPEALAFAGAVIVLLIIPLAAVGLALGQWLVTQGRAQR